jgi:hypothetical protein
MTCIPGVYRVSRCAGKRFLESFPDAAEAVADDGNVAKIAHAAARKAKAFRERASPGP